MKKLLLLAALVPVLWFGGRALLRFLASDEAKIRSRITAAAAAFEAASVSGVLEAFAEDYRDSTSGADRDALRTALLYLLLVRKDGVRYRVECGEPRITLAPSAEQAGAEWPLTLLVRRGDEPEHEQWKLGVAAELRHGDDGWVFVRSRHETVSGARPR